MRNKAYFVSFVVSLSVFIMLVSCAKKKAEWEGTIEEENGVKIIKNPSEPLYGEIDLQLEKDISVGHEGDEQYMFYRARHIEVDTEGNIFVVDGGNQRIQKFGQDGKYKQTIGRKGQGPGEFQRPYRIFLDSEDNIFVHDRVKIHVFSKNGQFSHAIPRHGSLFGRTKKGYFVGWATPETAEGKVNSDIALFDEKGEKVKTIVSYLQKIIDGGGKRPLIGPYDHRLRYNMINENLAIYGHSSEYKLYLIDASGKLVRIIERSDKSHSLTRAEDEKLKDDLLEGMNLLNSRYGRRKLAKGDISYIFPSYVAFFYRICGDDKGRIYVERFTSPLEEGGFTCDLFDNEGFYLYRIKTPLFPAIIRDGFFYIIEQNPETGIEIINRYRITNWKQIKEKADLKTIQMSGT